jgi:hypothetical protein
MLVRVKKQTEHQDFKRSEVFGKSATKLFKHVQEEKWRFQLLIINQVTGYQKLKKRLKASKYKH